MYRLLLLISCIFISSISFAEIKRIEDKTPEIIEALTELSKQIPQHYLSLDAVAEYNEYDDKKIIQWVKTHIQYSPSPGYQLTPEKSLHTATGNSLEQAVLLQNILTNAGFEVRIAQSELDETTATGLLKQSFNTSPIKEWRMDADIRDEHLKKFAKLYGQPENSLLEKYKELTALTPWKDSKLYKDSAKLAQTFYDAIDKKGAWKIPDDSLKPWVDIAQDYYFVKYRLSQGDQWLQAHPAFVDNAPNIEKSSYFTEDIAIKYHQIILQAFITRQIEGKEKETIAVTPAIKRNSLQLFEHQLTFATVPSNFQEALDKKNLALLYKSNYFIPSVDGELLDNTKVFSLDGHDYAAKDVLHPTQQFINTVKEKATKAGSALDSLPESEAETDVKKMKAASSILLDYYFKISWKAPNGDSRELKRIIYQQAENSKNSIVHDITQRVLLSAEPSVLTPIAQTKHQLNTQISIFRLMQKARVQGFSEAQTISQIDQWNKSQKDFRFNITLALSRQHNSTQQFFSASPMLAMVWERENYETDQISGKTSFDYLINDARIIKITNNQLALDESATVEYGVWSTYSEALVQAQKKQDQSPLSREKLPENVVSAAGQFNKAIMNGNTFEIITSVNQIKQLPHLNNVAKVLLMNELSKNPQYLYIFSKLRPERGYLAYYRVDKKTGDTLGYSEFGRGLTQAEYAQALAISIAFYQYLKQVKKCDGMGNTPEGRSCLFCAIALGAITLNGLGGAAATVASVAGGAGAASVCAPYL